MNAFEFLGLAADADSAAIKRAYSTRLHNTRPEDDPAGFQRLHEAYRAALAICRQRGTGTTAANGHTAPRAPRTDPVDHEHTASPALARPVDTGAMPITANPSPSTPLLDLNALAAEVIDHARLDDPEALASWLEGNTHFWSLQTKAATGFITMRALYRDTPPIREKNQDIVLRFFDLDHALAGHDPFALVRLRQRMDLAWQMHEDPDLSLAHRLRVQGDYRNKTSHEVAKSLKPLMVQLRKPFKLRQVLLTSLIPGRSANLATFILRASGNDPDAMPNEFDRKQMHFWLTACASKRISVPRALLAMMRSIVSVVLCLLALATIRFLPTAAQDNTTTYLTEILLFCGLGAIALYWLWYGYKTLELWQSLPEEVAVAWPWLCLFFVPLLALAGLAAIHMGVLYVLAALPLLILAFLLVQRRFHVRRYGTRPYSLVMRGLAWTCMLIAGLAFTIPTAAQSLITLFAGIVLSMWLADLWMQRRRLRVRGNQTAFDRP